MPAKTLASLSSGDTPFRTNPDYSEKSNMEKSAIKKGKITVKKPVAFIKRHKKAIIWTAAVLGLFMAFGGYRLWLNFHFLVTDDLVLDISPADLSITALYSEEKPLRFDISIDNSVFCDSYCSYSFNDISKGASLDEGQFTTKGSDKHFTKEYGIRAYDIGSGQKIYRFDISCKNIRNWRCPTNENERERSAFITLNYDLSQAEKQLKDALKGNITSELFSISELDRKVQEFEEMFFILGSSVNLKDISDDKDLAVQEFNSLVLDAENIKGLWSGQNFTKVAEIYGLGLRARISRIAGDIGSVEKSTEAAVERHNSLILQANTLDDDARNSNQTLQFLSRSGRSDLTESYMETLRNIASIKKELSENTFSNYSYAESRINGTRLKLSHAASLAKEEYITSFTNGLYAASLEKEKLCGLKEICLGGGISSLQDEFFQIDDSKTENFCNDISNLKAIYNSENNKSSILAADFGDDAEAVASHASELISNNSKNKILMQALNLTPKNINQNTSIKIIIRAFSQYNESREISDSDFSPYNRSATYSIVRLNLDNSSQSFYGRYCISNPSLNMSSFYPNRTRLDAVKIPEIENISSRFSPSLPETAPMCCIFGQCSPCCQSNECGSNPSLYPVLLLHGHSFNSDNSPDYSLDAFNKLISALEKDGYVNAGTITPISNLSEVREGEWGLSSKPIAVKGSYYLVSYYNIGGYTVGQQKSENIETYSIRLKELVDLLKFRTGRDKVIIVAHSMGGLVARSYLQIFGANDIDRLILIATPNEGVEGSASDYCPILGENKECRDMSKGSIFLRKLNDPLRAAKGVKIVNIVATGCKMGSSMGDGVVLEGNAILADAENFFVNGTCTKLETLHTSVLNVKAYPEVYEAIENSLSGSG